MSDPKPAGRHAAKVTYNSDFIVVRKGDLGLTPRHDIESDPDRQAADADEMDLPEYFAPRPTLSWLAR